MTPEDYAAWIERSEADLAPVVRLIVSGIPDRRGNFTCLAMTELGSYISLSQVAN
jgi:hypothetical protein